MLTKTMTIDLNLISKINLTNLNRRDKIFDVLKLGYASKTKQNLPIYGIRNKDLREFTTNDKDVTKGISRIPLQLARIYEEDIIEESSSSEQSVLLMEPLEILDNYTKILEHRSNAYNGRTNST